MSKNFLFKFVLGLVVVVAAVLWLLSMLVEDTFGWFSLGWAITMIAGVFGVMFILRGLFSSTAGPIKKLYIYFGAGLLIAALFALIGEIALPGKLVMPIIAIVVTVALLLGFVAVTIRTSDTKTTISVRPKKKRKPKRTKKINITKYLKKPL